MVTTSDIAKVAKVSRSTVSFVLNGATRKDGSISEATVERVLKVARDLGYVRNDLAIAVKTGKTKVIGFVCSQIRPLLLQGIVDFADGSGYLVEILHLKEDTREGYERVAEKVIASRLPGVYVMSGSPHVDHLKSILQKNGVIVASGDQYGVRNDILIQRDRKLGAELIVEHLSQLGHKNIAIVGNRSNERFNNMMDALKKHGIQVPAENIVSDKDHISKNELLTQIDELLLKRRPTAVCASYDALAIHVIAGALMKGIKVPEELSVVGYGHRGLGLNRLEITSVSEGLVEFGQIICELLIKAVENKLELPFEEIAPVELIVHNSTGPARNK